MRRATDHRRAGNWPEDLEQASITLAWAERHRRRVRMVDDAGEEFLLDLPQATVFADGDALALENGGWMRIRAAAEPVVEVVCDGADALARIAWHIGNRHAPLQILSGGVLRILDDHVLATMAEGLGGQVRRDIASFHPEAGAYASGAHHHPPAKDIRHD